jgi:hypothetical protein
MIFRFISGLTGHPHKTEKIIPGTGQNGVRQSAAGQWKRDGSWKGEVGDEKGELRIAN